MNNFFAHAIGRFRSDGARLLGRVAVSLALDGKRYLFTAGRVATGNFKKRFLTTLADITSLSPYARRKKPDSAGISYGLRIMSAERWVEALRVWEDLEGRLSGDRLQAPRAGRLLCGWLAEPELFREELVLARGAVAGSEVVSDTVVCSAIVGDHDMSWPPGGVIRGASYVRVTDDLDLESWGVWQNRPVEFHGGTSVRTARWVKTHPHLLFPDAHWVVWVDGNLIPVEGLAELLEEFKESGAPVAAIPHTLRSTVTQEIVACVRRGKDSAEVLFAMEQELGSDPGVGLWETGFMFFNLRHTHLARLLNRWWSLIEGGSHRDQISFPYAVRDAGVEVHKILTKGESTRSDPRFALIHHNETAMRVAGHALLSSQLIPPHGESPGV